MKNAKVIIRQSSVNDLDDIWNVEEEAFGSKEEASLSIDLIKDSSAQPCLSLLAYDNERAIGHILFTRAYLNRNNFPMIYILAPMAVIPAYQQKGIGGLLIKEGLKMLKNQGSELVFVLGHIDFYPRYGFVNDANALGFQAPYFIPEKVKDAWMVQELRAHALSEYRGTVYAADTLMQEKYWVE
jgi:putative acetyltransferase